MKNKSPVVVLLLLLHVFSGFSQSGIMPLKNRNSVSFGRNSGNDYHGFTNCLDLVGKWKVIGTHNEIKVEFRDDSMHYFVNINGWWMGDVTKYSCRACNDSIYVTAFTERSQLHYLFIKVTDQYSVFCLYKPIKGLEKNLSKVVYLIRKETDTTKNNSTFTNQELIKQRGSNPDVFILPDKYSGVLAVAYDQPDGIKPVLDSRGRRIYNILDTNSFLIKVQTAPDLFNYVVNNIEFYYRSKDSSLIPIIVHQHYDTISADSVIIKNHIFSVGYDRIDRNKINFIVGKKISTNILFFKITKARNYNEENLAKDSVFHLGRYYSLSNY